MTPRPGSSASTPFCYCLGPFSPALQGGPAALRSPQRRGGDVGILWPLPAVSAVCPQRTWSLCLPHQRFLWLGCCLAVPVTLGWGMGNPGGWRCCEQGCGVRWVVWNPDCASEVAAGGRLPSAGSRAVPPHESIMSGGAWGPTWSAGVLERRAERSSIPGRWLLPGCTLSFCPRGPRSLPLSTRAGVGRP